jgi:hypothetical protein
VTAPSTAGDAVEAAAENVYAYMRGVVTRSLGEDVHDPTGNPLPESWEALSPSWRARYRGIATAAVEGWQLHHTLHGQSAGGERQ